MEEYIESNFTESQTPTPQNFPPKQTGTKKKSLKPRIINLALTAFLLAAIISNIALLAQPIFHGTYKTTLENGSTSKIKFYDNTYTWIVSTQEDYKQNVAGLYVFCPATKYWSENYPSLASDKIKPSLIVLNGLSNSQTEYFFKKSVFKITDNTGKQNYYCGFAIFLQVVYALTMTISIIALLCFNRSRK